jgi:hypothetical protein
VCWTGISQAFAGECTYGRSDELCFLLFGYPWDVGATEYDAMQRWLFGELGSYAVKALASCFVTIPGLKKA